MTAAEDDGESAAHAFAAAQLGGREIRLVPIRRGGNARVWRVDDGAGAGPLAVMKRYPKPAPGGRDRLAAECAALRFLAAQSEERVPRLLAANPDASLAVIDFVPGPPGPAEGPAPDDIDEALGFVARLHAYAARPGAAELPPAAEPCPSIREIVRQVDARRVRLAEVAASEPALADPLARLADLRDRLLSTPAAAGDAELARRFWTLSPSDFGFHNAVRSPRGLVFLDFEYFGWDDPAKLAVDTELHPAMRLDPPLIARWRAGMERIFGPGDPDFGPRCARYRPFLALRWTCILLNEFLPERWLNRQHAGVSDDRPAVLAGQLTKAEAMLQRARRYARGGDDC